MDCNNGTQLYDPKNFIFVLDKDGKLIDFALKTGHPLISDFSKIDKEIIVHDNRVELGNLKEKETVCTIGELLGAINKCISDAIRSQLASEKFVVLSAAFAGSLFDFDVAQKLEDTLSSKADMIDAISNQVVFDVLYDKYIADSPLMTLKHYCENYVVYDWDFSPSEGKDKDSLLKKIDSTRKWMTTAIKKEVENKQTEMSRGNAIMLGRDPDAYVEFLSKLNLRFDKKEKKPKTFWDNLYYNGHPRLITSKQFSGSFVKQQMKKNNNYPTDKIAEYFCRYDMFVQAAFKPNLDDCRQFFINSMDFYHLEVYKRIDFIYKLAVRMELSVISDIDRNDLAVKRFHPTVFWPVGDKSINCLRYDEKNKYYRPLLLLEEKLSQCIEFDQASVSPFSSFTEWQDCHYLRAKVYELFNYNFKFESSDYSGISNYIKEFYDVLSYHEPKKIWIQESKEKKREQEIRIKNALAISEALFWVTRNTRTRKN